MFESSSPPIQTYIFKILNTTMLQYEQNQAKRDKTVNVYFF